MGLDERLGHPGNCVGKGQPIKTAHGEPAVRSEQAPDLGDGLVLVEPVPTLSGNDRVKGPVRQARGLGGGLHPVDIHLVGVGHFDGGLQHPGIDVQPYDGTTPGSHLAGDRARAAPQVKDTLARCADAMFSQAVYRLWREALAVAGVVVGCAPECVAGHSGHLQASRMIVTGPSLTRSTAMCARK